MLFWLQDVQGSMPENEIYNSLPNEWVKKKSLSSGRITRYFSITVYALAIQSRKKVND